ncbi:hypothetical protein ARHIZOSPH14_31060 [Agromyces rhizosphaerae]|uniref:Uncharacterized protein n=1 Tax=Agromyces rhizosphaerae TaxID=88374 RepID=A0A9W6CY23_9MICO|nr:hypothetical protein [Agromyces rhizosphaerae]GLI28864.1 hypothetical protein ARHIZOSPH14_31060 [Agromyces rhizosphaerae]
MTATALPIHAHRVPADRIERLATRAGVELTRWASRRRARRAAMVPSTARRVSEAEVAEFRLRIGVGMR